MHTDVLPGRVVSLLDWARGQEDAASGAARRGAQRFTREVISGILDAGYPTSLVADCLGVTASSVRSRVQKDGWLPARKVEKGARLRIGTLRRLQSQDWLPQSRTGLDGDTAYPAVDVIRALVAQGSGKATRASGQLVKSPPSTGNDAPVM
jgi:hypothetical protein